MKLILFYIIADCPFERKLLPKKASAGCQIIVDNSDVHTDHNKKAGQHPQKDTVRLESFPILCSFLLSEQTERRGAECREQHRKQPEAQPHQQQLLLIGSSLNLCRVCKRQSGF